MSDVYSDFKVHSKLNPQIWHDDEMCPEVRRKLKWITSEFYDFLDQSVEIKDVLLVGSMANYNYSSFSDIDLHLVIDFKEVDCDPEVVRDLMDAKKSLWNSEHRIMIRGHEVEVYVQDVDELIQSTGIYSILHGKWLRVPKPETLSFDMSIVRRKAQWMMDLIDDAMKSTHRLSELERLKEKIKRMRRQGLAREGEFSEENLAFKILRRTGYLKKLWNTYRDDFDKSLSLETCEH